MDTPSALSSELLDAVKRHLDAGELKEALELPDDNRYAAALKDNCWDLIPHLLERIEDDTIIRWPAMQRCCERLLMVVAEKANAEEVILELIEQAEVAKNDSRFIAILKPLQCVLIRLDKKRGRSLEWCVNTCLTYIEKLPLPQDYDLSNREKLLVDCDENARRIVKVYTELPTFYDYFSDQISKNKKKSSIKDVIACFLIDLLGKPFAHLDLEYDDKTKSQPRVIAERIFKDLSIIHEDLYIFLSYIRSKCYPSTRSNKNGVYEDAPVDIFLLDEKLSPISLGVLFYLLLVERLPAPLLPQIYSPVYIYREVLCLAVHLIKENSSALQYKGLKLSRTLLAILPGRTPASIHSTAENYDFAKTLCSTAVYAPAEFIRKESVSVIKDFLFKSEDKGRYLSILKLLPTLEHAGIKGYLITLYKDMLLEAYDSNGERLYWFKDKRLNDVLTIICKLNDGAETDIVESADCIIATLNLLRFLVLKDTKDENKTGIWDFIKDIDNEYMKQLREGLDMSRAHYEVKRSELDKSSREKDDIPEKFSITIKNTPLDSLPLKNKIDVIHSALNALHLVESLFCRLQECLSL